MRLHLHLHLSMTLALALARALPTAQARETGSVPQAAYTVTSGWLPTAIIMPVQRQLQLQLRV